VPQALALGIDRNVRAQLVTLAALDNETGRLGLSVGDETVGQEVLAVPAFRGLDGSFDREAYGSHLQQAGLSEREFEEQVRYDTARTLLQGPSSVPSPRPRR
jgi:peptidyl-prolyl cis-trans isomerase D